MKTIFFKNRFPFAIAAILGISGAFFTTSMQSAKAVATIPGYLSVAAPCDTYAKDCSDEADGPLCTVNGQQLFDQFTCSQTLREIPN